jgi:hypothetical protein
MLTSRKRIKVRGELSAVLLAINIILIIRNFNPGRADSQNDVKNYQGPFTSRENAIRKYIKFLIHFFKF